MPERRNVMTIVSLAFLLFVAATLVLYFVIPLRYRWIVLLAASYVFYWLNSRWLVFVLLGMTAVSYLIGLWIQRVNDKGAEVLKSEGEALSKEARKEKKNAVKKASRRILALGVLAVLSCLLFLKYYNFLGGSLNHFLNLLGVQGSPVPHLGLLVPLGISFYTLQAVGYITDVYWEKQSAEYNLGKLMLFLCFFPQVMEGPISLYQQTGEQLWNCRGLTAENLSQGAVRIFWGLFKKLVIADRLNVLVKVVFDKETDLHGSVVIVAAIAYTIQLYMEFSGIMDVVAGSGKMIGIILPENFRQPFFARSAEEFWRRWHISLGVWFKTYIFYPVSISGPVKKWNRFAREHKLGRHLTRSVLSAVCLLPVWLANGLWHGPRWSYIFFGIYYFVIIMAEILVTPLRDKLLEKLGINENSRGYTAFRIVKTWIIVVVGELFFRAETLTRGMQMFASIFVSFDAWALGGAGFEAVELRVVDYIAVLVCTVVVWIVDYLKEKDRISTQKIASLKTPVRWAVYYLLIFGVIILGAYGAGYQAVDLIYAKF